MKEVYTKTNITKQEKNKSTKLKVNRKGKCNMRNLLMKMKM